MLRVSKTHVIDQATLREYWHIQSRTGATTLSELYATVTLYAKDVFRFERKSRPSKGLMLSITPYVQVVHIGFEPMLKASEAFVIIQLH